MAWFGEEIICPGWRLNAANVEEVAQAKISSAVGNRS